MRRRRAASRGTPSSGSGCARPDRTCRRRCRGRRRAGRGHRRARTRAGRCGRGRRVHGGRRRRSARSRTGSRSAGRSSRRPGYAALPAACSGRAPGLREQVPVVARVGAVVAEREEPPVVAVADLRREPVGPRVVARRTRASGRAARDTSPERTRARARPRPASRRRRARSRAGGRRSRPRAPRRRAGPGAPSPRRAARPPTPPSRGPRGCRRRALRPGAGRRRPRGSGCRAPRSTRDGERMKRPWRSRLSSVRSNHGSRAAAQRRARARPPSSRLGSRRPSSSSSSRRARPGWRRSSSRAVRPTSSTCPVAASSGRCWKRESSHGTLMSEPSPYDDAQERALPQRPAATALEVARPVDLRPEVGRPRAEQVEAVLEQGLHPGLEAPRNTSCYLALEARDRRHREQDRAAQRLDRSWSARVRASSSPGRTRSGRARSRASRATPLPSVAAPRSARLRARLGARARDPGGARPSTRRHSPGDPVVVPGAHVVDVPELEGPVAATRAMRSPEVVDRVVVEEAALRERRAPDLPLRALAELFAEPLADRRREALLGAVDDLRRQQARRPPSSGGTCPARRAPSSPAAARSRTRRGRRRGTGRVLRPSSASSSCRHASGAARRGGS